MFWKKKVGFSMDSKHDDFGWPVASSPIDGSIAVAAAETALFHGTILSRTHVVTLSASLKVTQHYATPDADAIAFAGTSSVAGGGDHEYKGDGDLVTPTEFVRWFSTTDKAPHEDATIGYDMSSLLDASSAGSDVVFLTRHGYFKGPNPAALWLWRRDDQKKTYWARPVELPAAATPTSLTAKAKVQVATDGAGPIHLAWTGKWTHGGKATSGVVVTQLSPVGGPACAKTDKCYGRDVPEWCASFAGKCKLAWCEPAKGCVSKASKRFCGGDFYLHAKYCQVSGKCGP